MRERQLRPRKPAATVQDVSTSDPLAAIVALLQKQDAVLERLVGAVESLAEQGMSADASPDSDEAAPAGPPVAVLSPLLECDDPQRYLDRGKMGLQADLGVLQVEQYARFGGRGLYRAYRDAVMERSADFRRAVVADAQLEDPQEAAEMGADLLKYTGEHDEPEF